VGGRRVRSASAGSRCSPGRCRSVPESRPAWWPSARRGRPGSTRRRRVWSETWGTTHLRSSRSVSYTINHVHVARLLTESSGHGSRILAGSGRVTGQCDRPGVFWQRMHTVVKIISQFKAQTLSDRVGSPGQRFCFASPPRQNFSCGQRRDPLHDHWETAFVFDLYGLDKKRLAIFKQFQQKKFPVVCGPLQPLRHWRKSYTFSAQHHPALQLTDLGRSGVLSCRPTQ